MDTHAAVGRFDSSSSIIRLPNPREAEAPIQRHQAARGEGLSATVPSNRVTAVRPSAACPPPVATAIRPSLTASRSRAGCSGRHPTHRGAMAFPDPRAPRSVGLPASSSPAPLGLPLAPPSGLAGTRACPRAAHARG
jgi:hypothetical protein